MPFAARNKKIFSTLLVALTASFAGATAAHADPLTLSGIITMDKVNLTDARVTAHLSSSEFNLTYSLLATNWPGNIGCAPCPLDRPINIGASLAELTSGSGTIQGTSFPSLGIGGFIGLAGSAAPPVATFGQTFTLTAPFTASGTIGASHDVGPNAALFYTATVGGSGLATLTFVPAPEFPASSPHWYITRAVYQFQNAAEVPTPEPFTALLLMSGLGVVAVRYRR